MIKTAQAEISSTPEELSFKHFLFCFLLDLCHQGGFPKRSAELSLVKPPLIWTFDHLFVRLYCVRAFLCFARLWLFISLLFILFLLYLSLMSAEAPLVKYQREHLHITGGFPWLCRHTKNKIIECKTAMNLLKWVTSGEEVGTRSKINLRINSLTSMKESSGYPFNGLAYKQGERGYKYS